MKKYNRLIEKSGIKESNIIDGHCHIGQQSYGKKILGL